MFLHVPLKYLNLESSVWCVLKITDLTLWLCWVFVAARAFSGCGGQGLLFTAVHGFLSVAMSIIAERRLQVLRLQ